MSKKVLLGMSGGVDSSVSAILLKNLGYEVCGVTLHLYNGRCCSDSEILDAKKICYKLGIEHYVLDYQKDFQDTIINNFINQYSDCKTPNPCIECNKLFKFGIMYDKAMELGFDYISTGHYAKCEFDEKYNKYILKKADNLKKDQSYFLYNINKDILSHIIFPLANFHSKDEIRQIAKDYNFKVASKPDSQDICFITNGNYRNFLEKSPNIKHIEGNIVDSNGNILGKHKGLYNYTIGQRKGIGVSYYEPLYVIGFNKERNEVIVGKEKELYKSEILVQNVNLLLFDKISDGLNVSVKTRYSMKLANAVLKNFDNKIKVIFSEPQPRIASGQSCVFYIDDIVVGGGIII